MGSIKKFVEYMIVACTQWSLGYDQGNRWDVRDGGECDCSSLVLTALKAAGFDIGYAGYTGNMSYYLCNAGWKRVPADGNPKYGDILLNDEYHVAVYIGDGKIAQASIDENNGIWGGKAGDQTGYETNIRGYYDYPWNCYLRWEEDDMIDNNPHPNAMTGWPMDSTQTQIDFMDARIEEFYKANIHTRIEKIETNVKKANAKLDTIIAKLG